MYRPLLRLPVKTPAGHICLSCRRHLHVANQQRDSHETTTTQSNAADSFWIDSLNDINDSHGKYRPLGSKKEPQQERKKETKAEVRRDGPGGRTRVRSLKRVDAGTPASNDFDKLKGSLAEQRGYNGPTGDVEVVAVGKDGGDVGKAEEVVGRSKNAFKRSDASTRMGKHARQNERRREQKRQTAKLADDFDGTDATPEAGHDHRVAYTPSSRPALDPVLEIAPTSPSKRADASPRGFEDSEGDLKGNLEGRSMEQGSASLGRRSRERQESGMERELVLKDPANGVPPAHGEAGVTYSPSSLQSAETETNPTDMRTEFEALMKELIPAAQPSPPSPPPPNAQFNALIEQINQERTSSNKAPLAAAEKIHDKVEVPPKSKPKLATKLAKPSAKKIVEKPAKPLPAAQPLDDGNASNHPLFRMTEAEATEAKQAFDATSNNIEENTSAAAAQESEDALTAHFRPPPFLLKPVDEVEVTPGLVSSERTSTTMPAELTSGSSQSTPASKKSHPFKTASSVSTYTPDPSSPAGKARMTNEKTKWGGVQDTPRETSPPRSASYDTLRRADRKTPPTPTPTTAFTANPFGIEGSRKASKFADSPGDLAEQVPQAKTASVTQVEEVAPKKKKEKSIFSKVKSALFGGSEEVVEDSSRKVEGARKAETPVVEKKAKTATADEVTSDDKKSPKSEEESAQASDVDHWHFTPSNEVTGNDKDFAKSANWKRLSERRFEQAKDKITSPEPSATVTNATSDKSQEAVDVSEKDGGQRLSELYAQKRALEGTVDEGKDSATSAVDKPSVELPADLQAVGRAWSKKFALRKHCLPNFRKTGSESPFEMVRRPIDKAQAAYLANPTQKKRENGAQASVYETREQMRKRRQAQTQAKAKALQAVLSDHQGQIEERRPAETSPTELPEPVEDGLSGQQGTTADSGPVKTEVPESSESVEAVEISGVQAVSSDQNASPTVSSEDNMEGRSLWEVMQGSELSEALETGRLDRQDVSAEHDGTADINDSVGATAENADEDVINAKALEITALDIEQPPVPNLAYGLDRVLFNSGVYQLQDPHSRVYNFDPYLQKIMPVTEFDFNALKEYKTSSEDTMLSKLAKEHGKKYIGSTSSMTYTLSHFHYLLSDWRDLNLDMLSRNFPETSPTFTNINRAPTAMFLRYKDNGCYAIDADKEHDSGNVLMMLGKSMEKLLTMSESDYERYRKTDPREISDEEREAPEAYQYTTMGDFLMRSQLDAYDSRLPGTGMFDIKTRSVLSIRMNTTDFEPMLGYELSSLQGRYNSYEREYYDMMRSTLLKYMLQARMGRMDGIFLAYHNVERMFGFQYLGMREIDRAIHGQIDPCLGDQEFKVSLSMLNKVLEMATQKFPGKSLRFHFETRTSPVTAMYVFAEPMEASEIDRIQSTGKDKVAAFEREMMGFEKEEKGASAEANESKPGPADPAPASPKPPHSQTYSTSLSHADPAFLSSLTPPPSSSPSHAPLFAATLITASRVNGTRVDRPKYLTPTDDWTVEYLLREMENPVDAWAMYAQCKEKRRGVFAKVRGNEEEGQGGQENGYLGMLKGMAREGRSMRERVEKAEEGRGKVVYSGEGGGRKDGVKGKGGEEVVIMEVNEEGKIDDTEGYMEWLYRERKA